MGFRKFGHFRFERYHRNYSTGAAVKQPAVSLEAFIEMAKITHKRTSLLKLGIAEIDDFLYLPEPTIKG